MACYKRRTTRRICRKDGDVAVLPLYRHAQPAPKVMQSESAIADCDPEVYEKGVSVCLVAIPKETAEIICQNITAATGCKVDWHYFGGRVHIKALRVASQPAPVVPDGYVMVPKEPTRRFSTSLIQLSTMAQKAL